MSADEYLLDTPTVRDFIASVRRSIASAGSPAAACEAIRPAFARLLADPAWLPERFRAPNPDGGMGGGIGQWLLFRAGDRTLTLFALIVPAGSATPIHDHLAWGLVGLRHRLRVAACVRRALGCPGAVPFGVRERALRGRGADRPR